MDITPILDRVAKLLALAGNNTNENEAAAAIEKAYAILAAHNLTMAEVERNTGKVSATDAERGMLNTETNFSEQAYLQIWMAVAQANSCVYFKYRPDAKKRMTLNTLVGRKVNTLIASQMALYLCQAVRRLAGEAVKDNGRGDHGFKNAFIIGASARLCYRIRNMKLENNTQANALVLWSGDEKEANRAFLETKGVKLEKGRSVRRADVDYEGYHAGSKAGDKISLSQQVGGTAPVKQIGA